MNKTILLRGIGAALLSTAAAVAMAQGTNSGVKTSDGADRGSGSATGKSSNDAASGATGHKDKSMKGDRHMDSKSSSGKDASQAPGKGKGNADQNAPVTNKPSTTP
jgi:hypothetical protein